MSLFPANLETSINKFKSFASQPALSKAEYHEEQQLMKSLKSFGMSNSEISELSKGRWSESTIKGIVKGVKSPASGPWTDAVSLLNNMAASNLVLADVEKTVGLQSELAPHGLTIDQLVTLLAAAKSEAIDIETFVKLYAQCIQAEISLKEITEAVAFQKDMVAKGLDLATLKSAAMLMEKFGNIHQLSEALNVCSSIEELKGKINDASVNLQKMGEKLKAREHELVAVEAKLKERLESIQAWQKLKDLGYTRAIMEKLTGMTSKHGGIKKVLTAVDSQGQYTEILSRKAAAEIKLSEIQSDIGKCEAQHAYLKTAVSMCLSLINEHECGLDGIKMVFAAAKKYGQPLQVLEAIETYSGIQAAKKTLSELQGRVSQSQALIDQLHGKHKELTEKVEQVHALAAKVSHDVGDIEGRVKGSQHIMKLLHLCADPFSVDYEEYVMVAMLMGLSLKAWISKNENKFEKADTIKTGLDCLIRELGV